MADVPLADLISISCHRADTGQTVFRGLPILASLLKGYTNFRRVCPRCLEESSYHRAAWDLSFFSACPVHHSLMVDGCPDCGRPLQWVGADLAMCGHCGSLLTRVRTPTVEPDTLDGLRLACAVLGDHRFQDDLALARALPPLADLPEMAILDLVYRLGMDLTPGPRRKRFSLENPVDLDDEPHVALHRGLAAVRSWPDGLEAGLAAIREKTWSQPSGTVCRNWFGSVARWLSTLPPGAGAEIWNALEDLMRRQGYTPRWNSPRD